MHLVCCMDRGAEEGGEEEEVVVVVAATVPSATYRSETRC